MRTFKNIEIAVRVVFGVFLLIHGLYRIIFIEDYIENALSNSSVFFGKELVIAFASILPFIEFFIGALLFFKLFLNSSLSFRKL